MSELFRRPLFLIAILYCIAICYERVIDIEIVKPYRILGFMLIAGVLFRGVVRIDRLVKVFLAYLVVPKGAFNTYNFSYPLIYWRGFVDDVRVSRGARYQSTFTPPAKLTRDATTLLTLANDRHFGPFVPVDGPPSVQAAVLGNISFAPAER